MLRWIYWKNDKNRYKIYGKNDKTLAHFKKKLYLCSEISVRCSRTANITRESQVIIVRKLRTIYQELLILSGYEGARFSYTIKEIDVKRT